MMRSSLGSTLRFARPAVLCGLIAFAATLRAQELSESLSGGIADPLSGSIYTENSQYGPSDSIVVGANNVGTPYLHTAVLDPLGYLLESGNMTPYPAGGQLVGGYPDTGVISEVPADSTVAERFSEYHANFGRMSGAGARSSAADHPVATSSGVNRSSMVAGLSGAASARLTALAPFAAGSNGLANTRDAGVLGAQGLSAGAALAGTQGGSGGSTGGVSPEQVGEPGAEEGLADAASNAAGSLPSGGAEGSVSSASASSAGSGLLVGPATRTPVGQQPGSIFPDLSLSTSAGSGFPDSTMGTAGQASDAQVSGLSPLLSGKLSGLMSPFRSVSSEETHYLTPTLTAPSIAGQSAPASAGAGTSIRELGRKAKVKAMIEHPNDPLPSPFAQRRMEQNYERQVSRSASGRRASSVIVPSVTH